MAQQQNGSKGTPYTLYYNPYSICSIMMRYLSEIRGKPKDAASAMDIGFKVVDIFSEEQLSEDYLCDVNPNGQVPVLGSSEAFDFPLAQTFAISQYIAARYPELLPPEHAEETSRLLRQMHNLNFFSLSFRKHADLAPGFANGVRKRLDKKDISERYRKALEYKLDILKREKLNALEPEKVSEEIGKAKVLLDELTRLLVPEAGPWMFGQRRPTELDAHLVVVIARLQDVGLHEVIPDALKKYGETAMSTPAWQSVMEGRSTMYSPGRKE